MLKLFGTAQLTRNSLLKICGIYFKKCCVCIIYAFANFSRKFCDSWHSTWNFAQNIFPHFEGSLLDLFSIWFWFLLFVAPVATCTHSKGARQRDRAGREGRQGWGGWGNMLHALLHMAIVMIYVAKIFQARFRRAICLLFAAHFCVCCKVQCAGSTPRRERGEGERMADWALFKP